MAARIYAEFPKQIPPRINRFGIFTCTLNNTPAACDIVYDRRIIIYANALYAANQQIVIKIYGVNVPKETVDLPNAGFSAADFRKVWIGIDDDADVTNGIKEQGEIDLQVAPTEPTFIALIINNYTITSKFTR